MLFFFYFTTVTVRIACKSVDCKAAESASVILLLLGIETRWVALLLVPLMAGTIVLVHGKNGWLFTNKDGGWEFPAFWIVGLVVLALLGDGAAALGPRLGLR